MQALCYIYTDSTMWTWGREMINCKKNYEGYKQCALIETRGKGCSFRRGVQDRPPQYYSLSLENSVLPELLQTEPRHLFPTNNPELQGSNSKIHLEVEKYSQGSKGQRCGQVMAAVIHVTEGNTESYGRKLKWNLTQTGRNQNRLPEERIIRISPDDHYKKLNKKLCKIMPKTKNNTAWHIPEPKTNPKW